MKKLFRAIFDFEDSETSLTGTGSNLINVIDVYRERRTVNEKPSY